MELHPVDKKNIWKLVHLSVSEDQRDFVATNTESILEAYTTITDGGVALPFGIYDGDTPVGFVMLGYGVNDPDDPPEADGNYCLWRFMIDEHFQGQGYGKQAMALVLDYVKTYPCGPAKLCWLSYEPENEAAKALYHRFGFQETGEFCGDEIVAVLPL
ncbi:MAG: GNAT family N-acetyltransferase [Candidatus Avoscillospira sp.]